MLERLSLGLSLSLSLSMSKSMSMSMSTSMNISGGCFLHDGTRFGTILNRLGPVLGHFGSPSGLKERSDDEFWGL